MSPLGRTIKRLVYGTVELCTFGRGVRRKISGLDIRLPAQFSRYYPHDYEPETFRFINRNCRPGDTVLDLGAHLGLMAVAFGRCVGPYGKVFAFEPTPSTGLLLRRTARINHMDKVIEVRPEAVSGTSGYATFYDTADQASNANSLVRTDRSRLEVQVRTITVDEFVAKRLLQPSIIKIDVEGAELDVLHGAEKTIQQFRPAMWLALHPAAIAASGASLQSIWNLTSELKMDIYSSPMGAEKLATREWFCQRADLFDVELKPAERAS